MLARCLLLSCVLWLATASAAQAASGDFARGRVIDADLAQPVMRVVVPRDVYEWVTRSDLGDLRVFNGDQDEVPYALRRPSSREEYGPWRSFAVFTLPSVDINHTEGSNVTVEVDDGGTVVAIHGASAPRQLPAAFLIDAGEPRAITTDLVVDWSVGNSDFVGRFRVEASDDLHNWQVVVATATLTTLEAPGHRVKLDQIDLPRVQSRYLKLVQLDGSERIRVDGVRGRGRISQLARREWLALDGKAVEEGVEFIVAGRFPLDRLRVTLAADSYLLGARIFSRSRTDQPWRPRGVHTFYRVVLNEQVTRSPAVPISVGDRHWRVELENPQDEMPGLQIGWLPDELVIVRQGPPPFVLAYGQAGLNSRQWPVKEIVSRMSQQVELQTLPAVSLGEATTLGGPSRLTPLPEPIDWRTIVLWLALVAGVGIVIILAYRLLRT